MEGLGYDDREISGLDTDTVVQRAAQFCQVKDQEKSRTSGRVYYWKWR